MDKSCRRIIDTYLPLFGWVVRQLFGKKYGPLFARSLYPAPASLERIILQDFANYDPTWRELKMKQLTSSRERRRLRSLYKKQMAAAMKAEAIKYAPLRSFLDKAIQNAKYQGNEPKCDDIPKLRDLEKEYWARTEEIVSQPEQIGKAFPPKDVVDGRLRRRLISEIGGIDNYNQELATLIFELRDYPHDIGMTLSERHRSDIAEKFLDSLNLKQLTDDNADAGIGEAIVELVSKILQLGNDETTLMNLARKLLGFLLTEDIFGHGSSGPYSRKREVSIETPIGDGITLGDTLADANAQNAYHDVESKFDLGILLEDLPAAQRRAAEIYRDSEKKEVSVRDLCRDEKDYTNVRQAFSEVKKQHRR